MKRLIQLSILLSSAVLHVASGQECPEVPTVPEPPPRKCGLLSLKCKSEVKHAREDWENQMRRFGSNVMFAGEAEQGTQVESYTVGGCRGSIVSLDLTPIKLQSLRYELIAPSGTIVASEELSASRGHALGKAIRLPESGFYRVRFTSQTSSEPRDVCSRFEGSGSNRRCIDPRTIYVYPFRFQVTFRGNAEAPALHAGEQADGTVTVREPLSRRIAAEAGQRIIARVIATGGVVSCRPEDSNGAPLVSVRTSDGCTAQLPVTDRDATYVVALATASTEPVGVVLRVDEARSVRNVLRFNAEASGEFVAADARGGDAANQAEWSIDVTASGTYVLTLVPSGLARLIVDATVYNTATEEVLLDHVRAAVRKDIRLVFPTAGAYLLQLNAVSFDAQRTQGHAKYTLTLSAAPKRP